MTTLETPNCPLCGGTDNRPIYRIREYGVVRCPTCGLAYLSPRLPEADMLALYRSGEYFEGGPVGYTSYTDQELSLRLTFRGVVRNLVKAGLAGGDLLEVGCGYGYLLEEAQSAFKSCTGTEYSDAAVTAARERGLNVISGGLEALPPDARYDCIVAGHVLEHVYDPHAFLVDVVARLRPSGALVIGTPDMGSLWRKTMRSRWPSFKLPEHITYFDRPTLTRAMTNAGLEQIQTFPYRHAFPLSLVMAKLGVRWSPGRAERLRRLPIWLPQTTLAMSGRAPAEVRPAS